MSVETASVRVVKYRGQGRSTQADRRPMPADFIKLCVNMSYPELETHYRAATRLIARWIADLPDDVRAERKAIMTTNRRTGNSGARRLRGNIASSSEAGWANMCKRGDVMMRAAMAKFYANLPKQEAA
jgi:hypothetical protein